MKQANLAWLASLAVNSIVLWNEDEEDVSWDQAAIVEVNGDGLITADTMVTIQPGYGPIRMVRAGDLRPVATYTIRISIDMKVMGVPNAGESLTQILRGNLDSAISQGMLSDDTSLTIESHEIQVAVCDASPLFTPEQRKVVIEALVEDMKDSLANSEDYPDSVARHGHAPGYEQATDAELVDECRRQFGGLAERFEWAEDGSFDAEHEEVTA